MQNNVTKFNSLSMVLVLGPPLGPCICLSLRLRLLYLKRRDLAKCLEVLHVRSNTILLLEELDPLQFVSILEAIYNESSCVEFDWFHVILLV